MHAAQSVLIQGWRRALFRCLSQDDALISVSRAVLKSHDHWSHRGIHEVVYNGVKDPMGQADLQPYKRSMRAALGIPDDAWVLCYVASFVPWKDHQTLLEAFERLDRERLRAHLVLIGTGPLEAGLRKAVQDKPYAKCVHFLGARPDARRLLGIADAYVHTCREEGFGLAVVEAMLAGRPVIAPRSGAPAEYITDHWNGLLFEPGNPVDLADRINELASDHAAAMRMAELGRMVCLQKFSPQRFYEGVGEVIEQAVRAYRAEVPEIDAEFLGHA
jgi:glycosyltransferase involved in cell wall biosynthesis